MLRRVQTVFSVLALAAVCLAQTHTEDTLEDSQVITALKTFNAGISSSSYNNVVTSKVGDNLQTLITNAGSNAQVVISPGTWPLTSSLTIAGLSNFSLRCMSGAILQGATGLGANPVVLVNGAFNRVEVAGCKVDANSIGIVGIRVTGTGVHADIHDNEVLNTTGTNGDGIQFINDGVNFNTLDDLRARSNYVHNTSGQGISARNSQYTLVTQNRIENTTLAGIGCNGNKSIITHNTLKNTGPVNGGSISGFSADYIDWSDNTVEGASGHAIHADTVGGGTISRNTLIRPTAYGVFVEASPNVKVDGNTTIETVSSGIVYGATVLQANEGQIDSFDAITNVTGGAGVTATLDAADKQEGTGSLKLVVGGGYTTGTLFYDNVSALNRVYNCCPFEDFWLKSDAAVAAGTLQLQLSDNADLSSPVATVGIPPVAAGVWTRISLYLENWYYKQSNQIGAGPVKTWGIVALTSLSAQSITTIHVDDYDVVRHSYGMEVSHNTIIRPKFHGVAAANSTGSVHDNAVVSPGWNNVANFYNAYQTISNSLSDQPCKGIVIGPNNIAQSFVTATNPGIRTVGLNLTNCTNSTVFGNDFSALGGTNDVPYSDGGGNTNLVKYGNRLTASQTTWDISNQINSTIATGTAPFAVASTTNVPNLNASSLSGATFAAPGAIGGSTPAAGTFTTGVFSTSIAVGSGGSTIGLIKKLTDTPGAITVNANTCTDRTVADAGISSSAAFSISAAYALDAGIYPAPGQADSGGGNAHYRICNVTVGNITLNAAAAFNLTVTQ